MPQLRSCLITIFVAAFLTLTYATTIPRESPLESSVQAETVPFQELLDQTSDAALHGVLHRYMTYKYKHGVFREDRKAIEAIHEDDPQVAISLIHLARRQASNATTTTQAADTTTAQPVSTTIAQVTSTAQQASSLTTTVASAPTTAAQQTTTQQQASGSTAVVADSTVSATPSSVNVVQSTSGPVATTSVVQSSSTTNPVVQAPGPSSSIVQSIAATTQANPANTQTLVTSTLADGRTTTSAIPVSSPDIVAGISTNSIGSTVNAAGSTITTPIVQATTSAVRTTSGSSKSVQVIYTTTLPNGARSTVTYVTIIPASAQVTTPGVTATGSASLQNDAHSRKHLGTDLGALGLVAVMAAIVV